MNTFDGLSEYHAEQELFSDRIVYRTAAGAWCAGCFFLVQIYCSTLTSHLTAPNQKPIADTVHELADTPGVILTADKGHGLNFALQGIESGDFKSLADKFKRNPKLLCNATADCLESVNAAYGAPVEILKMIIGNDIKRTGTCNYYLMKEKFLSSNAFTMLPKNSPHTESMSIGILRLKQFGFYEEWFRWYLPEPQKCMELQRPKGIPRLSLGHLSSPFLILLFGYVLSISVFVSEKIIKLIYVSRKR